MRSPEEHHHNCEFNTDGLAVLEGDLTIFGFELEQLETLRPDLQDVVDHTLDWISTDPVPGVAALAVGLGRLVFPSFDAQAVSLWEALYVLAHRHRQHQLASTIWLMNQVAPLDVSTAIMDADIKATSDLLRVATLLGPFGLN